MRVVLIILDYLMIGLFVTVGTFSISNGNYGIAAIFLFGASLFSALILKSFWNLGGKKND